MCEFRVYLEGEMVMKDVIGESKVYEGVIISEVNVPATRLVLRRV